MFYIFRPPTPPFFRAHPHPYISHAKIISVFRPRKYFYLQRKCDIIYISEQSRLAAIKHSHIFLSDNALFYTNPAGGTRQGFFIIGDNVKCVNIVI